MKMKKINKKYRLNKAEFFLSNNYPNKFIMDNWKLFGTAVTIIEVLNYNSLSPTPSFYKIKEDSKYFWYEWYFIK
jgi:hypothetical protein